MRPALLSATLLGVWLAFLQTSASLVRLWTASIELPYSHGLAIVALCLWMVFRRGAALATQVPSPDARFLPLVALAAFMWLIAFQSNIQLAHQLLLPVLSIAAIGALWGLATARIVLPAVMALYLAVPVWDLAVPLLQGMTVAASGTLLRLIDVPHFISGNFVEIPSGLFEIADGCAGLHFLVAGLAIAAFYGELNRESWPRRFALMALAALFAIVGNWVRVALIIRAGHLTDMRHWLITDGHYNFGWALFGGFMVVFFLIGRALPATSAAGPSIAAGPPRIGAGGAALRIATCIGLLAVAPVWAALLAGGTGAPPAAATLPVAPGGWSGPDTAAGDWHPVMRGADSTATAAFGSPAGHVEVYVAYYAAQRQGKEMVGFGNSLLGRSLQGPVASRVAGSGQQATREWEVVDATGRRWLLWSWYEVNGRRLTTETLVSVGYGLRSLLGPVDSRIVASRAPCAPDCDAARALLEGFWEPATG